MLFYVNCKDNIEPLFSQGITEYIRDISNNTLYDILNPPSGVEGYYDLISSLKIFKLFSTSYALNMNFESSGEIFFRNVSFALLDIFKVLFIDIFVSGGTVSQP